MANGRFCRGTSIPKGWDDNTYEVVFEGTFIVQIDAANEREAILAARDQAECDGLVSTQSVSCTKVDTE